MTIVIKGVLDEKVDGLQNGFAKKFKLALEQLAIQHGGKLNDFEVNKGVVTVTVEKPEAANSIIAELKRRGKDAAEVPSLDAFFDNVELSKKPKQTA